LICTCSHIPSLVRSDPFILPQSALLLFVRPPCPYAQLLRRFTVVKDSNLLDQSQHSLVLPTICLPGSERVEYHLRTTLIYMLLRHLAVDLLEFASRIVSDRPVVCLHKHSGQRLPLEIRPNARPHPDLSPDQAALNLPT
jgi:hypothetical protein